MKRLLTAAAAALVVTSLPADAHTPGRLAAGTAWEVPDAAVSYALYGDFETGEELFVVALEPGARIGVPVEVFVPHESGLRTHRPAWALVGPGVPEPTADELAALPAPLPTGWGAVVDPGTLEPRPVFYEFVMRRFYWSSGAMNVVLPAAPCQFWVWSPNRTTGKFGLGFGVEEGGGYMAALADWSFYAY